MLALAEYEQLFWAYANKTPLTVHCLAAAVGLYAFYRLVIKKKYKLPPGPRAWPLVGNLTGLREKTLLEALNDWQKDYGDIMTVYLGPLRTIIISDIDKMTEAFVTKGNEFADRTHFYSFDKFSEGSKGIVMGSHDETWKIQRKILSQSLRQYLTGHQFEERCQESLVQVIKMMESKSKEGPLVLGELLSLSVFNVLHGLCFGSTFEFDDPVFQKLSNFANEFNNDIGNGFLEDVFPPLRYWPTKKFTDCLAEMMKFVNHNQQRVEGRRAEFDKATPICLADTIIIAQQELEETDKAAHALITDVHIRQIVSDVFGAGVDSSRSTLEWVFLVLIAYPDIQARMHKEIDEVVGERVPGKEHRAKLVYTEAVILEASRLYTVGPLGAPHQTKTDTVIGDYEIPAKTSVMVNQHLILRDPRHWTDPLTFKPERFMNEDGTKLVVRNRSFIPFSVGPRSCPGESLARLQILYLVVGLLQKFSFSLPPGEKADFTADTNFLGYRAPAYKVVAHSRGDF